MIASYRERGQNTRPFWIYPETVLQLDKITVLVEGFKSKLFCRLTERLPLFSLATLVKPSLM